MGKPVWDRAEMTAKRGNGQWQVKGYTYCPACEREKLTANAANADYHTAFTMARNSLSRAVIRHLGKCNAAT